MRDLHRIHVLPEAGAGRAEVGDPRRHGDPRAGQDHGTRALDEEVGQPRRADRGGHFPWNFGLRLPRNAPMPSRASSEPNTSPKAAPSTASPSSRSGRFDTFLIAAVASGAWPASLPRPEQRRVEQLVVGHHLVGQAEAVRLVGVDRVADQVHLERLGLTHEPRQPLRASEARDDPQVDLRLAERGRLGRDPEVARHRQLTAAAERDRVDGGDRDGGRRLHRRA